MGSDCMTVNEILSYLDDKFPISDALEFDNVGLLIGDGKAQVKKALISLDCTLEIVEKAVETGAELIITHHPVIFNPLKNVLSTSVVYELLKNKISVISMHTNLDVAEGGVNDCLCKALDLFDVKPYVSADGFTLRSAKCKEITPDALAENLKQKLGGMVKYVEGKKPIEKLLVCSGSGGEFVYNAIADGFDALISADIKHHQFLDAQNAGISIFDCGHFNTEDVVIEPLKELLKNRFSSVEFSVSHISNIKYK